MGAVEERLEITLQDARDWLRRALMYTAPRVVITSADIPTDSPFYAFVDGQKASYVPALLDTDVEVAAGLVAAITALAIVDLTATDGLDGTYSLAKTTGTIELRVSRGQSPDPETQEDYVMMALVTAAKQLADKYLNNPFAVVDKTTGEVITEKPIPDAVRVGVLQLFSGMWSERSTGGGVSGAITMRKDGDLTVQYATAAEAVGASASALTRLPELVRNILSAYRLMPGRFPTRTAIPVRAGSLTTMLEGETSEDVL